MDSSDKKILFEIGNFTDELKKETIKIVKENVNVLDIIEFIENKIFNNNYLPAFPCTICINEVAAHFTVYDENVVLKKGDVVKVDFGICNQGLITDTAFTVEINSNKYDELLNTNKEALNYVLDFVEVGVKISEIGKIVYEFAKKKGFNTIKNLSGHQIGKYDLHCGLQIPNYDNKSDKQIKENMLIAIEPFFTLGDPIVKEHIPGNILTLINDKPIRDVIARNVLKYIKENFSKLPFSKRWLLKKFDKKKVNYAINILKKENIIYEYNILISNSDSVISQFEETVFFDSDSKKFIITNHNK